MILRDIPTSEIVKIINNSINTIDIKDLKQDTENHKLPTKLELVERNLNLPETIQKIFFPWIYNLEPYKLVNDYNSVTGGLKRFLKLTQKKDSFIIEISLKGGYLVNGDFSKGNYHVKIEQPSEYIDNILLSELFKNKAISKENSLLLKPLENICKHINYKKDFAPDLIPAGNKSDFYIRK